MINRNRSKNHCQTQIFSAEVMVECANEQRVQSVGSKRFARKKELTRDQNKSSITNPNNENEVNDPTERKSFAEECKNSKDLSHTFVKTEDLLLNISLTSAKNRMSIPHMFSDRPQGSIQQLRNCNQTARQSKINLLPIKQPKLEELKYELQLKTSQILTLSEQNADVKRKLEQKQQQFQKETKQFQNHYQLKIIQYQVQIQSLSEELRIKGEEVIIKNQQIANFQKKEQTLINELNTVLNGQKLLQKQIDELRRNIMPKEIKDLVSFRQKSLMKQMDELKKQLKASMSENERHMEKEMLKLKEESDEKNLKYRDLQIYNRVLHRKISEKEKQLKTKSVQFNRSYSKIKDSHNEVIDQLKLARKENIKLRRLSTIHHEPRKRKNTCSPDSTSLNLSLSSSYSP